jgi:hypothetical protein
MAWYAIYDIETGALKSTGTSVDAGDLPTNYGVSTLNEAPDFDTHEWDAETKTMRAKATSLPVLSKFQFRCLFTISERVAMDAFESLEISEQYKGILRTLRYDLGIVECVELSNPQTIYSVNLLEQIGLIGDGRAAQILANIPPEDPLA